MKVSAEVLDRIFSFLVSHKEFLLACSKDPVLSSITEKHFYHKLTVHFGSKTSSKEYPGHVSKLVSKNDRIQHYVRILQIRFPSKNIRNFEARLGEFAKTLLKFHSLECIIFEGGDVVKSNTFRAALGDCLSLPTLKEVHVLGNTLDGSVSYVPLSLLNGKDIKHLLLSGYLQPDARVPVSMLPQLKSLSLSTTSNPELMDWLKRHINELESLKCVYTAASSELIPKCSGTLKKLDINVEYFTSGLPCPALDLDQLTIRTGVRLRPESNENRYALWPPPATDIIESFISPLRRHLVIDLTITLTTFDDFDKIDFSLLANLGLPSRSIHRIDLYVRTGIFSSAVTRALLLSVLESYEDIMKSVKEGRLVIHSEKSTPDVY